MQTMDEHFLSRIHSYLPAWQIQPEDDQPEAAVLYAAWRMLQDTRARMAHLPEKHETEFLRAWGLEPAKETPMSVYAAFTAPIGETVPAESQFYLSGNGTRLWNTTQTVHAESLRLLGQVLESGRLGKLLVLPPPTEEVPSRLFDFRATGDQRQAARFAHRDAFCSQNGCTVRLTVQNGAPTLLSFLTDAAQVRWSLELENGIEHGIDIPYQRDADLIFSLPPAPMSTALLVEVLPDAVAPATMCSSVTVSTQRDTQPYQAAICDDTIVTEGNFHPFGSGLELWRTCYVSCPEVLSLRDAQVTISYTLFDTIREERLPETEQPPAYRPIMRRLPTPPPPPHDVYAQSVRWEYWNGKIWLPIPNTLSMSSCFSTENNNAKVVRYQLRWPADAQPCEMQGQLGYWLRWQVMQADGSGYLPRRLHMPEIRNLHLSTSLVHVPVTISVYSGLAAQFQSWHPIEEAPLFPALGPKADGWWLRFDRAPFGEPLSLFADLIGRVIGTRLTAWESTPDGLRPLGLEDETDGLHHSGLLRLSGIRGTLTHRFGQNGWWICFRDECGMLSRGRFYPRLSGLYPGAVCLKAASEDRCQRGEPVLPFQGGVVSGVTLTDSFGGAPLEQESEILNHARLRRHHLGRGVSALDAAQLIQDRFRDVVRAHIWREKNRFVVAVLMRDSHQHCAAFSQRKASIARLLQTETVIPTLGLSIDVREPNFYPVSIMVSLHTTPDRDLQTYSEAVRHTLTQFLDPVMGGFQENGWNIGKLPGQEEIYNHLRNRLPYLKLMKILLTTLTPQGIEIECAQVNDPLALPVSGNHIIRAVKGEMLP